MRKIKWNIVFVTFTFCLCICVIGYTALKMNDTIATTSDANQNDLVLILDAGQEAYVVSIVV